MRTIRERSPGEQLHAETMDASEPFVGRWNGLVSTANWEKGRIIYEWRMALIATNAPAREYADEVWSRMVGGVTPQHVGRLRRVYERYHDTYATYQGLYWSHFHAALDWEDAEMWLEGAVQNGWSVSELRRQRWETLSPNAGDEPRDEEIVVGEIDEDVVLDEEPLGQTGSEPQELIGESVETVQNIHGRAPREEVVDDDDLVPAPDFADPAAGRAEREVPVQPFRDVAELPEDLAEAFEAFKLAILRHKMAGWADIAREEVLASIEALKQLVLAPAGDATAAGP